MSLFDLIEAGLGRPDPTAQMMAKLGQAPGQPGSPAAPQPLAPPPSGAPPGAAPPGAAPGSGPAPQPPPGAGPPGGAGGPPGGPQQQQQQQAPPQPQAYTSPPDLMQMYAAVAQRQQANEQFNRGLAGITAAFSPLSQRASLEHEWDNMTQDPGSLFSNMMALQNNQYQQQQRQQLAAAAPDLAKQMGVSVPTAQAIIASGKYGDVETSLAGVSGDPSVREMTQARNAWVQAHALKDPSGNIIRDPTTNQPQTDQPIPPNLLSVDQYKTNQSVQVAQQVQRSKDLVADQANFAPAKAAYDKMINDATTLLDPKQTPGLDNILGPIDQFKTSQFTTGDSAKAMALYNKIMAEQYTAGVQDFKGAGRITQQELTQDAPSQSIMKSRNLDPATFRAGVQQYITQLKTNRANLFGKSGQLGQASDEDYGLVNPIYKPGGDLYVPGQPARAAPSASSAPAAQAPNAPAGVDTSVKTPADVAKLPKGTRFLIPDGSGRVGVAPGS
jgi:hypothetical protein